MITISCRTSFNSLAATGFRASRLVSTLDDCCVRCVERKIFNNRNVPWSRSVSSLSRTSLASNSWLSSARHQSLTTSHNINTSCCCQQRTKLISDISRKKHSCPTYQRYCFLHFKNSVAKLNQDRQTMSGCKLISGKEVSDEIRANLKAKVEGMSVKPRLAIVQVGGREDSNVYIRMKVQFAESIGGSTELIKLGRETTEDELAAKVKQLNQDTSIHGIITQLPFDSVNKIDSDRIVNLIDPKKDVDGLSVHSAGMLLHGKLDGSSFVACTPKGCMELIKKAGVKIEGSRSVVFGRSKIVGSPMAQLLLWSNSTVTICHSKTKNPEQVCKEADIVVVAVGRAQMVKKDWIKPGAVVIDCGINVIPDASKKSGTRLVGDVDFEDCKEVAGAMTPVPGGVGPMTVAMLISNTVEAAERAAKSQ